MRLKWITTAAVLLTTAIATAQPVSVTLEVPTTTMEVGEAVDVQLICVNTGIPGTPSAPAVSGIELSLVRSTPSTSHFRQSINGVQSERTTHTFNLRLVALREGTYEVGPLTVEADGQTYQSNTARVVVKKPQESAAPRGDRIVFVEVQTDKPSIYLGETFEATLRIGVRRVVVGGRTYDFNTLRDVIDGRSSQFSVFADGTANSSSTTLVDSSGQRHRYDLYTVTKTLRPEQPGDFLVGPVFVKANYPTQVRRGFFGRVEPVRTRRETARADAIIVDVRTPPTSDRPAEYTGAVGQYAMHVSASPTKVAVGEPITLTIRISGSPLEGLAGPDLSVNPELTSRFDFTKDELVGDYDRNQIVFRRAIFPKSPGSQEIPRIRWSYFDTNSEAYVTLAGNAIPIEVERQKGEQVTLTLGGSEPTGRDDVTLTRIAGGISPNYVEEDKLLHESSILASPAVTGGGLVLPPLMFAVCALLARTRERRASDGGYARRRKAASRAHESLKSAAAQTDPAQRLTAIGSALRDYIGDRFNLGAGECTPIDVRNAMSEHGIDEELIEAVVNLLVRADEARYAGTTMSETESQDLRAVVSGWIRKLENAR